MTQLKVLRAILRKRGYLVIWQAPFHPAYRVGDIIESIGGERFQMGTFAIRRPTTQSDLMTQQLLSKKIEPAHWKHTSPTALVRGNAKKYRGILYWRVTRTTMSKQVSGQGPEPERAPLTTETNSVDQKK